MFLSSFQLLSKKKTDLGTENKILPAALCSRIFYLKHFRTKNSSIIFFCMILLDFECEFYVEKLEMILMIENKYDFKVSSKFIFCCTEKLDKK